MTTGLMARLTVAAGAALLLAGCGGGAAAPAVSSPAPAEPSAAAGTAAADGSGEASTTPLAQGDLAPPGRAADAFTYDPAQAPEGATMEVSTATRGTSTVVRLEVSGLQPDRGYAAHAHVNKCGPSGDVAGPHFQNAPDPAAAPGKPSVDPAYANPQNEVWLDLRTDEDGNGEATATVPFVFGGRAPASVVLHEGMMTMTEAGKAGSAGGRLACLTVPFTP
jgi:superoxide dismutase, Cu-Zn family